MKHLNMKIKKVTALVLALVLVLALTPVSHAASNAKGTATSNVIIRKSASTSSAALATIKKGSEVTVLSVDGDWAKVKDGGTTGYAAARYLKIDGKVSSEKSEKNEKSESSSSSAVTALRKGDKNEAVKSLQQLLIARGLLDTDATGYFGTATENAVKAFQKSAGISADGVAGKKTLEALQAQEKEQSSGSAAMQKGDEGSNVTALQKLLIAAGYLKTDATGYFGSATDKAVRAFQQDNGLEVDGVAGSKTVSMLEKGEEKNEKVTVSGALREGDENDEVKAMQKLLIAAGYLKTDATGFFGTATAAAVRAFQKDSGLTADGVVGAKTLEKLNASGSKKTEKKSEEKTETKTEAKSSDPVDSIPEEKVTTKVEETRRSGDVLLVDWWSHTIDNLIKRGATFTVTDVRTGKSFRCARYGGSNHLDAEPCTPEDAAMMYEIFDYTWTWSARAIWLTYDGVTYAAAMNGMPHGGEKITTNNFDGQFCIHFLNSRTHGGDQVNADMQKRIQEAFNAA